MAFGTLSETTRAMDLREGELDLRVFAQHCISWGIGVIKIDACVDLSVPNASISVYVLGVKVGECKIGSDNCCNIGGSVDGIKAVAKICLNTNPSRIVIDAELCAPFAGCKKYHVEIPIPIAEDVAEEAAGGLKWV